MKKNTTLILVILTLTLFLSSCSYNSAPPQVKQFINLTGYGNVSGPLNSTDNAIVRYDGISGKIIQNSNVTIDDSGNVFIPETRTITEQHQLVDKAYVDDAVTDLGVRFYMLNDSSGISDYNIACPLGCPVDGFDLTYPGLIDGQYVAGWISPENVSIDTLIAGHYDWNIFLEKPVGTRDLRVYWTLNERLSNGTEILIATSSISDLITSLSRDRIPLVLDDDYILSNNSRVVGKIYAVVGTSGLAPSLNIYFGGSYDSHWSIPVRSEFLSQNYIPYTGAINNVDLGNYNLTVNNIDSEEINTELINTNNINTNEINDKMFNQYWTYEFLYHQYGYPWIAVALNSGGYSYYSTSAILEEHPGVSYSRNTNTFANSGYVWQTVPITPLKGKEKMTGIFYIGAAFDDDDESYFKAGFMDTYALYSIGQGAWIEIIGNTTNIDAFAKLDNAAGVTTHATSTSLLVSKWYKFEVSVNDDATSINYKITDSPKTVTYLDVNITASMPTLAMRSVIGAYTTNSSALSANRIYYDYVDLEIGRVLNR